MANSCTSEVKLLHTCNRKLIGLYFCAIGVFLLSFLAVAQELCDYSIAYQMNEMQISWNKGFVLLTIYSFDLVFFHQALIRLLSSFTVISPPPENFCRRPLFNAQDSRLTYGTFYWLCCFLLCSSIPYVPSSPPILFCGLHIVWP